MDVSFGSKVRPRNFGCVAMGSALLSIFRSRLLVYSAGSGVNRMQVVLSGFSMRLFCFVQTKTLCRYGCIYLLNILVRNASPRGPMCFRCLIFSLSGSCELLFLLCFIASWT